MAKRPWITPEEVKEYTDYKAIQNRDNKKLLVDISRAEQYVIGYTNNDFADNVKYPEIPGPVKTATLLIAEVYAYNAVERQGELKGETFDDYSYTLQDSSPLGIDTLDLGLLLEDYVVEKAKNAVAMKLRKL